MRPIHETPDSSLIALLTLTACTSAPPPLPLELSAGWGAELILHPNRFATLIGQDGRGPWIAFHRGAWHVTESATTGTLQLRAAEARRALGADLAALRDEAQARLGPTAQPPPDLPTPWLGPLPPSTIETEDTLVQLAFGPRWTMDDARFSAPLALTATEARGQVRALDAELDSWSTVLSAQATPEGRELIGALQPIEVYRSRLLVDLARRSLADGHPEAALVLATAAQDLSRSRELSHINTPDVYAIATLARLRSGHVRASLDTFQVLEDRFSELEPLGEVLNDVAVAEQMGRVGLSAER